MTDEETAATLSAFARQLEPGSAGERGTDIAKARGWLDPMGRPTAEGRELIDELGGQDRTRSVFRTVL
ncbi:MAG: hypothetical protein ACFBSD_15835 [Paracoccaceae bacterium]